MKLNRAVAMAGLCVLFSHNVHAMLRGALSWLPVIGGQFGPVHNGGVVAECDALQYVCADKNVEEKKNALQALRDAVLRGKKDINGTNGEGRSGLHILGEYIGSRARVAAPCEEIVKATVFLLQKGADVKQLRFKSDKQSNLLHMAAVNGYHELVIPLDAAGLDINATDGDGETALHIAAGNAGWCKKRERGNVFMFMDLLIGLKADVNKKCESGWTPLHWADTKETIDLLIADSADVGAVNNEGKTPLHNAAVGSTVERIETLLAHGANTHAQDANGRTPLQVAEQEPVSCFFSQETKQRNIELLTQAGRVVGNMEGEEKDGESEESAR